MATYTTKQKQQPPQGTHVGIAALNPAMAARGHPGASFPDAAASYGLWPWLQPMIREHSGHNPQLDNRGVWPFRITGFAEGQRRATVDPRTYQQLMRRMDPAAGGTGWGTRLHQIVQRRYVNVPIWSVLGAPGSLSRMTSKGNFPAFARPQPNVRARSLAAALNASAQALQQARGG